MNLTTRRPPVPSSSRRSPLIAAMSGSGAAAVLGLIWLLSPRFTLLDPQFGGHLLATLVGSTAATIVLVVVALVGVGGGTAALVGALPASGLVATAVLQMLVFGVALGSMGTLSSAGYLVAMAMPLIVLLLIIQVIRRYPRARWFVGLPAGTALLVGAVLLRAPLREIAATWAPAFRDQAGGLAVTLLLVAIGALWAAVAVSAVRGAGSAGRATDWVTRHRVLFTVIAACGPLPYAVARLSWLTPWPLFAGPTEFDLTVRVWGLILSTGCWLGFVLTLGLIRPWGEVFPRWIPVVAGRSVPVAAAAVPGGTIAALLCFAAVPLMHSAALLGPDTFVSFAIVFPCWFWGPALALAVWGYVGHRRGAAAARSVRVTAGAGAA